MFKSILFYILFLVAIVLNRVEACEIISYARIIRSDNIAINFDDITKKSDCSTKIKMQFLKAISTSRGVLNARILSEELNINATIRPSKIKIESLEENLIQKYDLSSQWAFRNTHSIGQSTTLTFSQDESLSYECQNCTSPGEKNIKLTIHNALSGTKKIKWIKSSLLTRSYALVSHSDFNVDNKPLNIENFSVKEMFSAHPEKFFIKKNMLRFYKLNKILRKGKPLIFSTLSPVSLVKNGEAATVILQNKTLSLHSKAIPIKNGFFGDTIQLRNIHSNKLIIGKVVDFNKVVVEL